MHAGVTDLLPKHPSPSLLSDDRLDVLKHEKEGSITFCTPNNPTGLFFALGTQPTCAVRFFNEQKAEPCAFSRDLVDAKDSTCPLPDPIYRRMKDVITLESYRVHMLRGEVVALQDRDDQG